MDPLLQPCDRLLVTPLDLCLNIVEAADARGVSPARRAPRRRRRAFEKVRRFTGCCMVTSGLGV